MKLFGAILKGILTLAGIYLVAYLIGRLMLFVLRIILWPSKYGVHPNPGFFRTANIAIYSILPVGILGAGLSGRFDTPDQLAWAWIIGVILALLFLGTLLQVIGLKGVDESADFAQLQQECAEIDREAASRPDPVGVSRPKHRLKDRAKKRFQWDYFHRGSEFLN
jgi:hypothetical protein